MEKCVFIRFENTDSTNMRAREYAKEKNAEVPAFFIADMQSAGRGRLGRSFYSPDCAGLYMTLLFKSEPNSEIFARITAIAAVCASDAVFECTGIRTKIKWVNDLYSENRKVAGILAESFVENGERFVALGVGINIFETVFPIDIADKAGALLSSEAGVNWREKRDELALCLGKKLLEAVKKLDFGEYIEKYREYSCVIGKKIRFSRRENEYFATALDITDSGALLVLCENGEKEELSNGEISVFVEG